MTDTAVAPAARPSALIREALAQAEAAAGTFAAGPGIVDDPAQDTGTMLALYPPAEVAAAIARPDGTPADQLHVTLVTFPWDTTDAPTDSQTLAGAIGGPISDSEPLTITLTHGAWLGPEQASYVLEGNVADVTEVRDGITEQLDAAGVPWSNDYAYRLHLTLGDYPEGDPARDSLTIGELPEPVQFTVVEVTIVWGADRTPLALGPADGAPDDEDEDAPLVPDPEAPDDDEDEMTAAAAEVFAPGDPVVPGAEAAPAPILTAPAAPVAPVSLAWQSPLLVPFGVLSGDRRRIRGPLRSRPLPLPLAAQFTIQMGHDHGVIAGRITSAENSPAGLAAAGDHDAGSPHGREAHRLVREQLMMGVSVDLCDLTVELVGWDPETDPMGEQAILEVVDAELMGATQVMHPAFREATLAVVASGGGRARHRVQVGLTASGGRTLDGAPLALLNDAGEPVAFGTPIPGQRGRFSVPSMSFSCGLAPAVTVAPEPEPEQAPVVAAAGAPALIRRRRTVDDELLAVPPASWFAPLPADVSGPVRLLDPAGEVGGYIARWKDCHVGYADRCVPPPRSQTGYRTFRTGTVATDDGRTVQVGPMFADTVHPDLRLAASDAFAHYHDTGCLVAQVTAGEDEVGVWVHGALMPELSPRQLRVAQAGRWSGDWRVVRDSRGKPELLSVLAVNGPGFATPADEALVAAGRPGALALFDGDDLVAGVGLGLVAAGDPCDTVDTLAAELTAAGTVTSGAQAALVQLIGQLSAQVEMLQYELAEHRELLGPARAAYAQQLTARLAAVRTRQQRNA